MLPTEAQLIAAFVGAVVGLWSSAVQGYGDHSAPVWAATIAGQLMSAIMLGVVGSVALHQIGPGYPIVAPLAGLPEWLTACTLSASSQLTLPLLSALIKRRSEQ